MTDTIDAIAIDLGAARIKIAFFDPTTQDVEVMRIGSDGGAFIPSYFGVDKNGRLVVGEQAEKMLEDENLRGQVWDTLKRDIAQVGARVKAFFSGAAARSGEEIWAEQFAALQKIVEQHRAFVNKGPSTVYLTHSLNHSEKDKSCLMAAAKKAFPKAEVELIAEATAASWTFRKSGGDFPENIILLDCGAATVEWCYLTRAPGRNLYKILPEARSQTPLLQQRKRKSSEARSRQYSLELGGYNVDSDLLKRVKSKAKNELRKPDEVFVMKQIRDRKEEFCNGSPSLPPIEIPGKDPINLTLGDIDADIRAAFINPLCESEALANYIENIKDWCPVDHQPIILLVGGSAKLIRSDKEREVLKSAFGTDVILLGDRHRGNYATVLGAMYFALDQMPGNAEAQPIRPGTTDKDSPETRPTLTGKDNKEMVLIPGGEFRMGLHPNDDDYNARTIHVDSFYMDKYLVTNAEYKQFIDANPAWRQLDNMPVMPKKWQFWKHKKAMEQLCEWASNFEFFEYLPRIYRMEALPEGTAPVLKVLQLMLKFVDLMDSYLADWDGKEFPVGQDNHPVRSVSWYAAMAYAQWAGKRLPTDAEWEKAAQGGLSGKIYPWGDEIDSTKANYGDNVGNTTVVGSYPANDYGLYDMAGNVQEWCLDDALERISFMNENDLEPSKNFQPVPNPIHGAPTVRWLVGNYRSVVLETTCVTRGGCFVSDAESTSVGAARAAEAQNTWPMLGFRCVRDVTP